MCLVYDSKTEGGVEGGQTSLTSFASVSQEAKQLQCFASNRIELNLQSEKVLIYFMLAFVLFYDSLIFSLYHTVLLFHTCITTVAQQFTLG